MEAKRREDVVDRARVQFIAPRLGPLLCQVAPGAVDGLGHIPQVPLGVVEVDDLDGPGKVSIGEVPDPERAVSQYHAATGLFETTPGRLADHALNKLGRMRVGVARGSALDCRRG